MREQLEKEIVKVAPEMPTGDRTFYMPHKPVVRESASTTKERMVFNASGKSHPLAHSINECMYTGPSLQPLLWDISLRAHVSTHLVLVDIQKAFLQIGVREEDRDAFPFLFNINGQEQHQRFTHNREREADLQGCLRQDKEMEHGSFRAAEESGSHGLIKQKL